MPIFSSYSSVVSASTEDFTLVSRTMPGLMRLFLLQPQVIFKARINMATAIYPVSELVFDGVTVGSYTAIKAGMTLVLGSTLGGDQYGRQRVRAPATSTTIPVGLSSQGLHDGELIATDNAYVEVWDDHRVWAKIGKITVTGSGSSAVSTTYKDATIAYTDQNTLSNPVSNTGPGFAGTIDSATNLITVQFDGTRSFATAPGATITTYLWAVGDGTITVGTSASNTITCTFPPGFRYISLTITDSNSKQHVSYCPVYARDPAEGQDTTIQNWQIENHRITQEGQQIAIRVFDDISALTYPDNTLVMIWEGESTSASDRSGQILHGWIHTDPASISAERNGIQRDTTLNCLDVAGKLATLPGFPQTLTRINSPTPPPWSYMPDLYMDRYLHYLLQWHSTALDVADWTWTNTGATYNMVQMSSDAGNLWEQVSSRAKAIVPNHILTCNTLGQLATLPDPILQNTADRTATVQVALDEDDWSDIRWTHQRPAAQHWLRGSAVIAGTGLPIATAFCVAPGDAPAQGEQAGNNDFQLANSQQDLNDQEGHRYARVNSRDSKFSVSLVADSDLGIEPANMTWVSLNMNLPGIPAQRGGQLTAARGLVHAVNIRYEYSRGGWVRSVELEWERERSSTNAAVTYTPPHTGASTPEFELTPDTDPDIDMGDTPTGMGTVYAMTQDTLGRTRDLSAASPAWVDITPAAAGTHCKDFILDPWAPATTGYLASLNGVYKSTDMDGVTPTWTEMLSAADILAATGFASTSFIWAKLLGSPNANGYLAYFYAVNTTEDVYCAVSNDGGATWSHNLIVSEAAVHSAEPGACDIVPHTVGGSLRLYMANAGDNTMYRSDDAGATWAAQGVFPDDIGYAHCVHCPYDGNDDGQTVWVGTATGAGDMSYISTDGGATFTAINGGRATGPKRGGLETYTQDSQMAYMWEYIGSNDPGNLWVTADGGATWTQRMYTGLAAHTYAASGFPYNSGQYYVLASDGIFLSTDGGLTFVDKTGDWAFGFSFDTVDFYANAVIVSLWTE